MCLPPAAADDRACALGRRWGFPNNYTLSKHLAEQLVAQAAAEHRLPVCIVRPSLVTAVLYEPIPGHIGEEQSGRERGARQRGVHCWC
jgi:fatty acyl-CoA reductase